MICAKIHQGQGQLLLAACDEEIVGKTFRGNGLKIEVYPLFYKDLVVPEEEFLNLMSAATVMNLVGENVISIAIREGYVDEENVMVIGETKHAQVVKI